MLAQRTGGVIVNILSIQMYTPLPQWDAYCASKAGLHVYTRGAQAVFKQGALASADDDGGSLLSRNPDLFVALEPTVRRNI